MLEVELIAEYLLENSYVSSERDAYEFIPHMSDYWLGSLLESSELQDLCERQGYRAVKDPHTGELKKVEHKKTSLYDKIKSGKVTKTPEGKLEVKHRVDTVVNPLAAIGRGKRYKNPDPRKTIPNYQALLTTDKRSYNHPHGGAEVPGTNIGVPAGTSRGKKRKPGAPIRQPESPVAKYKRVKEGEKAAAEIRNVLRTGGKAWQGK